MNLGEVLADKLKQLRGAYPQRQLEFEGDVGGFCDGRRLHQLLGNLVENAIKHDTGDKPVRVAIVGGESDLLLEVRNSGAAIEPSILVHMFEPLVRPDTRAQARKTGDLGSGC